METRCRGMSSGSKSNMERSVAHTLGSRGIDVFLPLRKRSSKTKLKKDVEEPLFSGYVFASFEANATYPVVTSPGVAYVLRSGSGLAEVAATEIQSLRAVCHDTNSLEHLPTFHPGELVQITEGPLAGVQAVVIRDKTGGKLVVSISLLQRSVIAQISRESAVGILSLDGPIAWPACL